MSVLLLLSFLVLTGLISARFSSSIVDWFLRCFLVGIGILIPSGYFLGYLSLIDSRWIYLLLPNFLASVLFLWFRKRTFYNPVLGFNSFFTFLKEYWFSSSITTKAILFVLFGSTIITFFLNVVVFFATVPNEWDSMTGHLVKCLYYIQNGSMARMQGTTWTIDFYPNALPTLQIFGFYTLGEIGFKGIHFYSYLVFVFSIYGISGYFNASREAKVFASFMAALLPSALIQATTTETDLVQTAIVSVVVYFTLHASKSFNRPNLFWLVLALSIWISLKVTFMLIGPSYFLVFMALHWKNLKHYGKVGFGALLLFVGGLIYVLPTGYVANVKEVGKFSLGAMSAPPEVMKWHGIEHYTKEEKLKNFKLNVWRYSSDFLHLDGLRSSAFGEKINDAFRFLPNQLFNRFNLERNEFWVVSPFRTMGDERFQFHKERPYWGIIFFLFVPVSLILYVRRRNGIRLVGVFTAAFILHFLSLSFSAPYDPIKGRYFMNAAVWLLPLLGILAEWRWKSLKLAFVVLIGVSAILSLTHRKLYPWVGEKAFYNQERIEQLVQTRPELKEAYVNFEKLVPKDAVVALGTQQEHEDYEYPFWGKNFSRTLLPVHPFRSDVKPIPEEAEFLVYSEGVFAFMDGDVVLNKGDVLPDTPVAESTFYLRKLK